MSNYSRNTCSVVSKGGSPRGLAHGTDRDGNAPLVPATSVSLPTAPTHCQLLIRPAHSGRKSFAELSLYVARFSATAFKATHRRIRPLIRNALTHREQLLKALYRALLRLAPMCKAHIQAVFRFLKVRTKLSHQKVLQILVSALGLELVREAWAEARKEIDRHVETGMVDTLQATDSGSSSSNSSSSSSNSSSSSSSSSSISSTSSGTASSSLSACFSSSSASSSPRTQSAHATTMAVQQQQQNSWRQQRQQQQPQPNATATHTRPRTVRKEEEEESMRRVRLRTPMFREMESQALLSQQNIVSWRADGSLALTSTASTTSASAAAAEEDAGISLVLESLPCPPPSPSVQREDHSHSEESTASTITAATRAAAAASSSSSSTAPHSISRASSIAIPVNNGETDFEDEDLLLQDAPNNFVCPISLQLMTRAVVAGDGYSYQREALDTWILQNRRERKPLRSPMTNAPMAPFYIPSFTLRSMVRDYMDFARANRRLEKGGAHVV